MTFDVVSPSGALMSDPRSPFPAGANPRSIALGDFNGDANLDLAAVGNGELFILLGDGRGGFGDPTIVPTGFLCYTVAAGDFNGDGHQDLAVAGAGGVLVFLGDGTGGFTSAPGNPFVVESNPVSVALGDFNGDGILDLATANIEYNTVDVLLGNGTGGFAAVPGSPFDVGTSPVSVAVGDFNGDGKLDLVTANEGDNTVTVLQGNGLGEFTAAPGNSFAVGLLPVWLVVGDFNGDGRLDLVTANGRDKTVTVLLGNGFGEFTAAPGSPFTVGSLPQSVSVGDFNGDGSLDIATPNFADDSVTMLLGNGSGGFTAAFGSPYAVGSGPFNLAVGDFNGDGKPDLAIASFNDNNVTVLLGATDTTTSVLSAPSPVVYATPLVFTLTVSASANALTLPSGTATFYDGSIELGAATQTASPFTFATSALAPGSHTLTGTYSGDAAHTASSAETTIFVIQPQPIVSWPEPAAITVGTPLSAIQLDATADVPGTFIYDPPAGTVLAVGDAQKLFVIFTPTDPSYKKVVRFTEINVELTTTNTLKNLRQIQHLAFR